MHMNICLSVLSLSHLSQELTFCVFFFSEPYTFAVSNCIMKGSAGSVVLGNYIDSFRKMIEIYEGSEAKSNRYSTIVLG